VAEGYQIFSPESDERSDAVFRLILMASDPEKYGQAGAVLRARIEKELRPKIEAEVREELAAKGMGPRTPAQGAKLRRELDQMLSDLNRRMGGNG
jgi:hypothetical protein